MNERSEESDDNGLASTPRSIFLTFLRLGCTLFGGSTAHLGDFREEFVVRKKWADDLLFTDIVGLCQFPPGPASSPHEWRISFLKTCFLESRGHRSQGCCSDSR
jgi:chromate transporter